MNFELTVCSKLTRKKKALNINQTQDLE